MHSHQETFPDLGLFILIQLPVRGVMFRLRRKRTTLSPALSPSEQPKPIAVEALLCGLRQKRTDHPPKRGRSAPVLKGHVDPSEALANAPKRGLKGLKGTSQSEAPNERHQTSSPERAPQNPQT